MPKVEYTRRSHGPSEYTITLSDMEMDQLWLQFQKIADATGFDRLSVEVLPILPQLANSMDLLNKSKFPTPFN